MDIGSIKQVLIKNLRRTGIFVLAVFILFFLIDKIAPVNTGIDYSQVIESRDGSILHAYLSKDQQWCIKVKPAEITPELKKAIIFKEDKHFYYHPGIDLFSVVRAYINNIARNKRTSGASTITMQVARLIEPKPRTYLNKCIEMFRALQLELHYSKNEILYLYLNLVPYGSNIQGLKAASLFYFNKSPEQLSVAEITTMAVIPNCPNSLLLGKNNDIVVRERIKWLYKFKTANIFPGGTINDALAEPLTAYRHSAPNAIPQFAARISNSYRHQPEVLTTIDRQMQQQSENIVMNYMNRLKLQNINNASVLIIDNKSHEVCTYIGSSDFGDKYHYGQVDGVRAIRSPGSTLKPLLYGLCIDKGLITPKTMIADVPVSIKGYSPENYDRMFRGNVTAEYALSHSLNIPAVKLLENYGIDNFLNSLSKSNCNSIIKDKKKVGLSLILGGCGLRLEELTNLYSTFANNGCFYPLKFTINGEELEKGHPPYSQDAKLQNGINILSPAADYMLTHILCQLHRPDLPNAFDEAWGIPRIAWKTGTSYGRKDAWSIGYNQKYTIGVWVGNFSAIGNHELSGATTATPLLFELFNAIDHDAANEWLEPPASAGFRLVCSETGKIPNDFCNNQIMDYYIPGVSSNEKCDHLKTTWLSADEQYCYCTACLPPSGYKNKLMPNISSELAAYYNASHIAYTKIPPHNPACTRNFKGQSPVITSLTNGMTYLIENKGEQKLQLSCTVSNDVHKVFWYINDRFFSSAGSNQKLFFSPPATTVKISCADDKGRNTDIMINVKLI